MPKHQHIPEVANLEVQMIVKNLKSKDFLEEVFCWQWGYFFLTSKGVKHLIKELSKTTSV